MLSFITFALAWLGSVIRTIGVASNSDDIFFIAQFAISATLNSVIMMQFGLYWNSSSDKKVSDASKDKAKTKKEQ